MTQDKFKERDRRKRNIQKALLETSETRFDDTVNSDVDTQVDPDSLERIGLQLAENQQIGIPDDPNKHVYSVGSLMLERYDDKYVISNLDKVKMKTVELDKSDLKDLQELFKLKESNKIKSANQLNEEQTIDDESVFRISKQAETKSKDASTKIKNLIAEHNEKIPTSKLKQILSEYNLTNLLND